MAHTARSDEDKKEHFDPPEILEKKVDQLVQWIKESKHMITFTGAGISTGAGIPDFRSGMGTSLKTGPGVWELSANRTPRDKKYRTTSTINAIPTPTHMMYVKLHKEGIMKCCVSQNTDGLLRRSGLPKSALCELHGNSNLDMCNKCGKEYLRDFFVHTAWLPNHLTGRECDDPKCRGPLRDTIINFGETLPEDELTKAFEEGETADLCISMGSSLTVTPAADIPKRVAKRRQKLVIVNLQATPLDHVASLVINALCEDVSRMVMAHLGLEIPEFKLKRRVLISTETDKNGEMMLLVQGRDIEGLPFSFFKKVLVTVGKDTYILNDPFCMPLNWQDKEKLQLKIKVTFHANYSEPPLTRDIIIKKGEDFTEDLLIVYSPVSQQWEVTTEEELTGSMAAASISS